MQRPISRIAMAVGLPFAALSLVAGCGGGSDQMTQTTASGGGFAQLPPGKVEKAAPSNAHKEIPTRFGRTTSLSYRSTVLYAKAIDAVDPLEAGGGSRVVGVSFGLRNVGTGGWIGSISRLSRLATGAGAAPEHIVGSFGSSTGPCPGSMAKGHSPVTRAPMRLTADQTTFACVRFRLPQREKPILFKFAVQQNDYTQAAAAAGSDYGVWALPGTLVDICRYEPKAAQGGCRGLEENER